MNLYSRKEFKKSLNESVNEAPLSIDGKDKAYETDKFIYYVDPKDFEEDFDPNSTIIKYNKQINLIVDESPELNNELLILYKTPDKFIWLSDAAQDALDSYQDNESMSRVISDIAKRKKINESEKTYIVKRDFTGDDLAGNKLTLKSGDNLIEVNGTDVMSFKVKGSNQVYTVSTSTYNDLI